ncbi:MULTISPECIES: Mov34/MPN/PAD-1 family protein [Acinetobacter calcoaceticus/baumannii complex]|uniref:JAB domain-containing protein n=2 Tax=Acinetobacter baumannii TaxID=470 RepID=A0A142G3W7_ACIBA|nr:MULTISPECIES: Mov34/MPN/PAD-1 family protein [Acinetobacter calcoaceticus/baumannii complex]AMQ95347.1 hypothetical protein [Acinetobacter baumannii]EKU8012537.1 Mov34/MPN/PAD-1 family protein [Acinetobacter baumannii]EKV2801083.1 Mov34/MPN/PAD-1 family protein [Acinetobacter baumannii]EKV2827639.1 Mov34/MPN/PAD-1 family protein [Acinetobacter baumannii]EXD53532.1 hypothetical protein J498_1792 [Acinetobacter baumannii 781407]
MIEDYYTIHLKQFELFISYKVIQTWMAYRQLDHKDLEACGVLIGNQNVSNQYWIEDVTEPMPTDCRSTHRFILKDPGHQKKVDLAFSKSNGTSIYLGTWHSHPQAIPTPSNIDYADWESCISRNPDRQLFFVIVGFKVIRIFFFHPLQDWVQTEINDLQILKGL